MNYKLKDCCGCTACQQICPTKCITMESDKEGFLYPKIDGRDCIQCNKCKNICPIYHSDIPKGKTEAYVGHVKDEYIRKSSSSGGIFSIVAGMIIKQNGVVFGAAFDEEFMVHHIGIESEEELPRLRGSKYVQSRLENTYSEVEKWLRKDRIVLFSGTACQIAGLKKFLNKEYENLYTIDVLCHGVPSPEIWKMYLKKICNQYKSSVHKIEFRNKDNGWKNFLIKIEFSDMCHYCEPFSKDKYMRMFLGNLDLRPSCYDCHFKSFPRVSDITIGDCWGIENHMQEMDDDKGTSVISVHTDKGREIIKEIQKDVILKKAELNKVLPQSVDSRKSVREHPNRNKYLTDIQAGKSFDELYKHVKKNIIQKIFGYLQSKIDLCRK